VPAIAHVSPNHDEELVARLAVDDLVAGSRDDLRARAQVAECAACAELLADVRAISAATAELPPPRRTRDFRLTEADAARLRPAGWRGLVAQFGSPSFAFTRPLAAGLATLGIAGLLFATIPLGFGGAASLAPERVLSTVGNSVGTQDSSGAYATAAPVAPSPAYAAGAPAASPQASAEVRASAGAVAPAPTAAPSAGPGVAVEGGGTKAAGPTSAPVPATGSGSREAPTDTSSGESTGGGGPSALVIVSIVLLVAGIALGALRIVARRLA
jgi:hypothetical protein